MIPMAKNRIEDRINVSKEATKLALAIVEDLSTHNTRLKSSKAMPHPDPIDDFYGVCEYCGSIEIIVLDMDKRFTCLGCLKARD
jgi:hypothetical protein